MRLIHLPVRDPVTPATQIDLSLYYNDGVDELPPGREAYAAEFDIRGVVGLAYVQADAMPTGQPGEVLGIPIAQKCRRLHFLHAAWGWRGKPKDGTEVGVYRIHYADGQQKEIPIIYGEDLRMFYLADDSKEALAANTKVVLVGEMREKMRFRHFHTTWENERPDVTIKSLDFISRRAGAAPSVAALTVEP